VYGQVSPYDRSLASYGVSCLLQQLLRVTAATVRPQASVMVGKAGAPGLRAAAGQQTVDLRRQPAAVKSTGLAR
jgi:hypothetical protein